MNEERQTYILLESSLMNDNTMPTAAFVYENKTIKEIKEIFHSTLASKYANGNIVSGFVKILTTLGDEFLTEQINPD